MGNNVLKPSLRFKGFTDAWEQCKLNDICRINGRIGFRGYTEKDIITKEDGGVLTYSPTNIIDNQLTTNCKNTYITRNKYIESPEIMISNGDVLFVKTGSTLGKSALVKDLFEDATLNPQVIVMRVKSGTESFFSAMLTINSILQQVASSKIGGAVPTLTESQIKNFDIINPRTDEEKSKIGNFFSQLDNLITLHQRKYDKLVNVKKALLDKMFPKNGEVIPILRFKGFTDTWEQCKFKDVFVKLQNNSLSRADLNDEFGYAMNVHYGDVLIKFNEILDFKTESVPYITEPTIIEKYKNSFLQNGDIIIADAAEDNTVGKCCEIAGLSQETVLSGLHTIPCRPSKDFASGFLGYYMNSGVYHDQLLPLIQGSKISSISINTLSNTSLVYPKSIEEQSLIANKFRALDKLITLHQRKYEKLQNIKKALLKKMFI